MENSQRHLRHTRGFTAPRSQPHLRRSVAPYALILVWAGALALSRSVSERVAVALMVAATLAGAGAWAWSCATRIWMRDRADRFIAHGTGPVPPAAVVAERRAELLSGRERRMLAATVRRTLATAERPPRYSSRVPVDVRAVRAERARLEELAERLCDAGAPVAPRGVALTLLLVTDAASPLYRCSRRGPEELHGELVQTLFELEARPPR